MADLSLDRVGKAYGNARAVRNISLEVEDREFVVLVGPSGCGKTTILRLIAGLETVTEGLIRIAGAPVNDLPPRDRDVAMVFQSHALYPHLSVRENIAFGLKVRGERPEVIAQRVARAASLLGLDGLLDRLPDQLSGGQRQRVAMGRAIVRDARVFLMDEPLSNLDATLRSRMRTEIVTLQRQLGLTTVYVTHDQVEAMTMGHRIAVMRDGQIEQVGPPQELYDHPATAFVAGFLGSPPMTLLPARRGSGGVHVGGGLLAIDVPAHAPAELLVGIRPEHLHPEQAPGRVALHGIVDSVEALGSSKHAHIRFDADSSGEPQIGTMLLPAHAAVAIGDRVTAWADASRLHFFDAATGGVIR